MFFPGKYGFGHNLCSCFVALKTISADGPVETLERRSNMASKKKTKLVKQNSKKRMLISQEDRERMVREAAYYKAEKRNFIGSPYKFWFEAEAEIDSQ